MPLTKRQFELGVDKQGEGIMRRVYELLSESKELAYSQDEIQGWIQTQDSSGVETNVERALEVLVGIGAVEERGVGDIDYFACLQEFDTGTWISVKQPKRSLA